MSFSDKLDRANDLFNGMADRLGVDMASRVSNDPESIYAYRNAVIRCSGCENPEACQGWQVEHPTAREAPSYCRNRDALRAMK
ncbi:DUF6455 family protein [Pseudooceanicola sp.]|uniref:DUF6455 family protein n=1 Tax=Pseudooceanicola sp. TaxID=1914328 RepID=UPI0026324B38|nr:DUF6455 family protein [Pseudooceanicola sp.]MDF1855259.1 DUF6455 family protein [Pseudooceanicola sp.]